MAPPAAENETVGFDMVPPAEEEEPVEEEEMETNKIHKVSLAAEEVTVAPVTGRDSGTISRGNDGGG
jgi:hypothetical protein